MTATDLKLIRKKYKMSQHKMALLLGYTGKMAVYFKESGKRPITKQDEIIIRLWKRTKRNKRPIISTTPSTGKLN